MCDGSVFLLFAVECNGVRINLLAANILRSLGSCAIASLQNLYLGYQVITKYIDILKTTIYVASARLAMALITLKR
ncbi:hypothetical protein NTGHW29_150023 [Candidatus Nitrotoga sp. HW29]|nr:hypothetical protein NTGHW29_150023 [Candidatus Nitrotoga sp. HW29]